jgi:hypothetical protein
MSEARHAAPSIDSAPPLEPAAPIFSLNCYRVTFFVLATATACLAGVSAMTLRVGFRALNNAHNALALPKPGTDPAWENVHIVSSYYPGVHNLLVGFLLLLLVFLGCWLTGSAWRGLTEAIRFSDSAKAAAAKNAAQSDQGTPA